MAEKKMPIDERFAYLRECYARYVQVGRLEKMKMLDKMVEKTGLHRKHLTYLMRSEPQRKPRGKGSHQRRGAGDEGAGDTA